MTRTAMKERKNGVAATDAPSSTTVGNYLLDRLHQQGVEHIFGIPGDYVLRFDKMIEQHPIQFINATRENTAGYMADAYARLRGLGVACITYGVGINIANAMSQAYVESSPLVVISGTAGTDEFIKGHKLHHLINKSTTGMPETTQMEIFRHITVDQAILDNPSTAAQQIDRVIASCLKHKKPVYIEIPRNIVEVRIPTQAHKEPLPTRHNAEALEEAIQEVVTLLKQSKQPVIWIGHEIQRFGLAPRLLQFAEKYHIPIVSSLLGKTAISEKHPLFVGVYQGDLSRSEVARFIESCDCALILGVVLSDVDTGIFTSKLDSEKHVIATAESVNVLHHHYPDVAFTDFVEALAALDLNIRFRADYPACIERSRVTFKPVPKAKTTTKRLFECIQHHLRKDDIVVTDVGDCLFGSADLILEQNSFMACAYFATLGFGTPGALGAQFAAPQRRVIGIVGDGAFQMTSMELSTAVRYGLDPVIIVMNNHGYGTERPLLEGAYNDIQNWNYTEIPAVLGGGIGIKVTTEEELDKALTKALGTRGTFYLIEVELGKTDFSSAMERFGHLLGDIATKRKHHDTSDQ